MSGLSTFLIEGLVDPKRKKQMTHLRQTLGSGIRQTFSGRRGRDLKETLTAYLFLSPALILIFVFGLFPVGFALYVSLHKWLIIRGDFLGLANYVDAIDDLAYIGLFFLAIGSMVGAFLLGRKIAQEVRDRGWRFMWLAVPGALHAATVFAFFRWLFFQLPEFLDIAEKMRGLERTRGLFMGLLSEAFRAETVYPYWLQFIALFFLALSAGLVARKFLPHPDNLRLQSRFAIVWGVLAMGFGLLMFNFQSINRVYAAAVQSGEDPGIWPQVIMVMSGALLLLIAWYIWKSAERRSSAWAFGFQLLASIALMVGAVILIIEVPTIVAMGDEDLWNGLKVTVFFSVGTVPVQLAIALFLSVLLFQKLKGSGVFRVIYFLPYVTPAVATATIFRLLFSERETAPINTVLQVFGGRPQEWLREAQGVFTMLANNLGISGYPQALIPDWIPHDLADLAANWMAGPSQAMMVVIMLSVWTFVGYNVVIYLAGLSNIPTEVTEAAEIDGANRWGVFRHITFPLLSPTTYFLSLIAVIGTFKAFNTMWVMRLGESLGTIDTISIVIFDEFFTRTRYGYASALAFVLFAIILSLTVINNRVQGSRVFYD